MALDIMEPSGEGLLGDYSQYGEPALFSIFLLVGLITNLPLVCIYIRSKHIRSIGDKFLFNMLIADMLSLLVLAPTVLWDLIFPEQMPRSDLNNFLIESHLSGVGGNLTSSPLPSIIGDLNLTSSSSSFNSNSRLMMMGMSEVGSHGVWTWSCTLKKSLLSGVSSASIIAALEIAMERYLAVVTPFHYHKFLTKPIVYFTSGFGHLIAVASAVLSSIDPCEPVFPSCMRTTLTFSSEDLWWPIYTLVHVTLFFVLPVFLMIFIYIRIWWEARRQRSRINQQFKKPFFLGVDVDNQLVKDANSGKLRVYLHPIILRFKIIDRLVTARMDRAARVAIATLVVTIMCWSPYYFIEATHAIRSIHDQMNGNLKRVEAWNHMETIVPLIFACLHPVLSPFFYAYRYKRVRQEVSKKFPFNSIPGCCGVSSSSSSKGSQPKGFEGIGQRRVTPLTPSPSLASSTSHTILNISSPSASSTGLHNYNGTVEGPLRGPDAPGPRPQFHLGNDSDAEMDHHMSHPPPHLIVDIPPTILSHHDEYHRCIGGPIGLNPTQDCCSRDPLNHGAVAPSAQRSHNFIHNVAHWMSSYSKRWHGKRESVSSTASVVTLLSTRSHSSASCASEPPSAV